jgi:hypothetical protein
LEATLSLAAAVTEAVIAHGNRIDLLSVGDQLFADREALYGEDHMTILEHLALAEPCPEQQLDRLYDDLEQTQVTWDLVIVLSHLWGADRQRLFELLTRHHVSGVPLLVSDGSRATRVADEGSDLYHVPISEIAAGTVQL